MWFILTAISVVYTAWDLRTTPEMKVMKPGWVLVVLFTGPLGAAIYVLSCKEPAAGRHEQFVNPLWKQAVGSTVHCLAGDATGVIIAATITTALGQSMLVDFATEYFVGFAFGLFVFQALFMRQMMKTPYLTAVRNSFLPELLSMNCVMAGMGATMFLLMANDMTAMHPSSLRFWGVMSLATVVGMFTSYPVNVWLVAAGLKHGMGTVRVLGEAGMPAPDLMPDHMNDHGRPESRNDMSPTVHTVVSERPFVTNAQLFAVAVLTFLALGSGLLISGLFGDPFGQRQPMKMSQSSNPGPTSTVVVQTHW